MNFLIFLTVLIGVAFSQTRCAVFGEHLLEWTFTNTTITMKVNISKPGTNTNGWGAIGFNSVGKGMIGSSIIMGYSTSINEYRASSI